MSRNHVPIPKGLSVPPLTRLTRKRLYIPQVDVSLNPFAQERQLTDKVMSIQRKPQMVVDCEVLLAKLDNKPLLPTSVFAPAKDVLTRSRNSLFGTVEGAEYILSQRQSTLKDDSTFADEDGPGIFVPDPNDIFAPPDKTYFPDPFEVATNLVTKPPPMKDTTKPTTFGHRPRSASRHFDPLTMNANRFRKSANHLPQAGLLTASDLHKMLKHGMDVVGMGPSPAEQGKAPLPGSTTTTSSSQSTLKDTNNVTGNVTGTTTVNTTTTTNAATGPLGNNMTGGLSTLDGQSTLGDSIDLMMAPEVTQRTTAMTVMEREAPMGLVQAPQWMGGVYSTGMGKSLFNKTETQLMEKKKRRRKKKKEKKYLNGRPLFSTKIFHPPPQRAFRSQLQEDDFSMRTSKEKLSRFATLSGGNPKMNTCELRQKIDERLKNDSMNRILKRKQEGTCREYSKSGVGSTTPRKRFSHDIAEIEKEVERRMERELRVQQREEEEAEEAEEELEDGGGGEGGERMVGDSQQVPR
jgi:hypothetical protein